MGCRCNRNNNDVDSVFYPNRDSVKATVDFDDLCRAVRRCLDKDKHDDHRDGCCWKKRKRNCGCGLWF